ncbi:MAG: class I tRNA ligase family protein [Oscillospiraceae bacterium]
MDSYELGVAAPKIVRLHLGRLLRLVYRADQDPSPGGRRAGKEHAQQVLVLCAHRARCKLLHPFMPFITEEIWQALPHEGDFLMLSRVARGRRRAWTSRRKRRPWS